MVRIRVKKAHLEAEIWGAQWNREGVTREVILLGRYAFKVPRVVYGWRLFLCGLLANMQEAEFSRTGWPELCPVVFSVAGGFLVVMRRAEPVTDEVWATFDAEAFCTRQEGEIPAERKQDSFGLLQGRIVAIDYGN